MRIAYLSYSSGEYDARTFRMARSSCDAGHDVTVYARWVPGLDEIEVREGYRIVRVPADWRLGVPGLRARARRRSEVGIRSGARSTPPAPTASDILRRGVRRLVRVALRPLGPWRRLAVKFPLRPMGWAAALEGVAEPADIWHGMWAGSLPALERLRRRHGGRTIYDSRDVYMQSREFARSRGPMRWCLARLERRWARACDLVLTVNESYAGLLADQLHVASPRVVMNCPPAWYPPLAPPDRIRERLGLTASTRIVLYQGQLIEDRGIEPAMAAILDVPDAVLALLGFGPLAETLTAAASEPPYHGKVAVLPPVDPEALADWTASADVSVMAIQPTSPNHAYTTPQKLFESIAVGVPVVVSELPGMAGIVRRTGVGVVCDPTSPSAIAAAIRAIIDPSPDARAGLRAHVLRVAHAGYTWEAQLATLFGTYRELEPRPGLPRTVARGPTRDGSAGLGQTPAA